MEFKKERVYSAVNADELKPGDKVIVADDLDTLKRCVKDNSPIDTIRKIGEEDYLFRFGVKDNCVSFALAYLVERAEPKTEQKAEHDCKSCKYKNCGFKYLNTKNECDRWETEHKAESHYRPFKDTDELIKVWEEKHRELYPRPAGTMPYIWVRRKEVNSKGQLITEFGDELHVSMGKEGYNMTDLFVHFTFLDGSPCGVEE